MKVIIDRSKWLRGEGYLASSLLRVSDQKMCCIGFVCKALGVSETDMAGVSGSHTLGETGFKLPEWLTTRVRGADLFRAYDANDQDMPESEREARITAIFARHDIEVEFIN